MTPAKLMGAVAAILIVASLNIACLPDWISPTSARKIAHRTSAQPVLEQEGQPVLQTAAPRLAGIEEVFYSEACTSGPDGGFVWMSNNAQYVDWIEQKYALGQTIETAAKIDFPSHGALFVDYGANLRAGTAIALVADSISVAADMAIVKIKLIRPSTNLRVTQAVIHPCAMYAIPRQGYRTLVVQNELGDVLMSFGN